MCVFKKTNNTPIVQIGFKTSNEDRGTFDAWNTQALGYVGTSMGALDPNFGSFHIYGDLYQVQSFARAGHESSGSVNVRANIPITGETVEFSHVFYIDTTGHGRNVPNHWNHELYTRKNNGPWQLFKKSLTNYHNIPDSENIIIWAKDKNGKYKEKKVEKKYRKNSFFNRLKRRVLAVFGA